jgi:hypothetical protein
MSRVLKAHIQGILRGSDQVVNQCASTTHGAFGCTESAIADLFFRLLKGAGEGAEGYLQVL